jgi:FkbM family methyltransferase
MRRLIGFLKSIIIYYNPVRYLQLKGFYRQFVAPGDLCFDVGAHVGNRTAAFISLGARVVSLEPQRSYYRFLKRLYGRRATVLPYAAGDCAGSATIRLSPGNPTLATLSDSWISKVSTAENWRGVRWTDASVVTVVTVDQLIDRFGVPAFIKIDVEGHEEAVLQGLSSAVNMVSVEFMPADIGVALLCIRRLDALSRYEYNLSFAERAALYSKEWLDSDTLVSVLRDLPRAGPSGDVYARLKP